MPFAPSPSDSLPLVRRSLIAIGFALASLSALPVGTFAQAPDTASARAAMRPCLTRKESRMFDFWVGEWDVKNAQGQPAGQSSVQLLLEGCALFENWTDRQGGSGKSLNSYNTNTQRWQQFWTDQYGRVTEYRESEWINGSLRFTANQTMPRGPAVLHMTFTSINPDLVRQWGEISMDGGKSWSPSFDLYYHRKK